MVATFVFTVDSLCKAQKSTAEHSIGINRKNGQRIVRLWLSEESHMGLADQPRPTGSCDLCEQDKKYQMGLAHSRNKGVVLKTKKQERSERNEKHRTRKTVR